MHFINYTRKPFTTTTEHKVPQRDNSATATKNPRRQSNKTAVSESRLEPESVETRNQIHSR